MNIIRKNNETAMMFQSTVNFVVLLFSIDFGYTHFDDPYLSNQANVPTDKLTNKTKEKKRKKRTERRKDVVYFFQVPAKLKRIANE